jgi:Eukaryotic mitochondrial regulator protein
MDQRLNTLEGNEARELEEEQVADLLTNDNYADQTMKDRMASMKFTQDHPDEILQREAEIKNARGLEQAEIQYNGRLSPLAREEIYRTYLKGTTIKELSLKFGILPQRVKAIIFQRHLYWNEVYPKLGETHLRMAFERELLYATDFPFVDYGKDLNLMAEIEKGIQLVKVARSDIDANPPE